MQGHVERPYQQSQIGLDPHYQYQKGNFESEQSRAAAQHAQQGLIGSFQGSSEQARPYQGYPQQAYNGGFQ